MANKVVFLLVALILAFAGSIGANEKQQAIQISLRDFCDPATFNAALGAGTCVRDDNISVNGAQTFAGFLAELAQEKSVGAWRFNPDRIEADEGVNLTLVNRGGETHTFTRVQEFGGGFVAPLNAPSGNPVPAPECAQVLPDGRLAPQPPSANNIFVRHGETEPGPTIVQGEQAKFQCCIHPWMRTVVDSQQ